MAYLLQQTISVLSRDLFATVQFLGVGSGLFLSLFEAFWNSNLIFLRLCSILQFSFQLQYHLLPLISAGHCFPRYFRHSGSRTVSFRGSCNILQVPYVMFTLFATCHFCWPCNVFRSFGRFNVIYGMSSSISLASSIHIISTWFQLFATFQITSVYIYIYP